MPALLELVAVGEYAPTCAPVAWESFLTEDLPLVDGLAPLVPTVPSWRCAAATLARRLSIAAWHSG